MTLTLELDAREQAALEAKAARLGVPVERFALGVLRREVESDGDTRARRPLARALALRDELAATIHAGTMSNGAKLDAAADLTAMREERFADAV